MAAASGSAGGAGKNFTHPVRCHSFSPEQVTVGPRLPSREGLGEGLGPGLSEGLGDGGGNSGGGEAGGGGLAQPVT